MRHFFLHEQVVGVVFSKVVFPGNAFPPAPGFQGYGLPLLAFCRAVGRIQNTVYDITIVKSLFGGFIGFKGIEHVHEHVVVAQLIEFVADGE